MAFFLNFPFWAALTAIFFAQFVKVPLHFISKRRIDWSLLTSTGGMPSSHSAAVAALTTAIALEEGLGSRLFAVSAIFGMIVMFDASGVRRHAGEQAIVLNKLAADFALMLEETKVWHKKETPEKKESLQKLKELLGHKPSEVFFGAVTGIALTMILYLFMP